MAKSKLTKQQKAQLCKDAKTNRFLLRELGAKYGISTPSVWHLLQRRGIQLKQSHAAARNRITRTIARIISGEHWKTACAAENVSWNGVRRYAAKNEIDLLAVLHKSAARGKGRRFCSKCQTEKPVQEFCASSRVRPGRDSVCKMCQAMKARLYKLRKYGAGATVEAVQLLFKQQRGRCAICKTPLQLTDQYKRGSLSIDHDHTTGQIRGLLCRHCNFGLGHFFDDAALLIAASKYLQAATVP